jgi:hypothetical protein
MKKLPTLALAIVALAVLTSPAVGQGAQQNGKQKSPPTSGESEPAPKNPPAVATPQNWSGNVNVASIEVSNASAPGVWVSFTTAPYASIPCAANKNVQYWMGGGQPNVDKMTAIATSALVNSRTVTVLWSGNCSSGYPVLIGLTLK